MPKQGLEKFLDFLFEANEVEAPKDAPFGNFLWADPKYSLRRNKKGPKEEDTELEQEFLEAIRSWFETGNSGPLLKFRGIISKIREHGWYKNYLLPPKTPVYRFLSSLKLSDAAKLLEISEKEITANAGKPIAVDGPLLLGSNTMASSRRKELMSWTVDPHRSTVQDFLDSGPGLVSIAVKANPYDDWGSEFFLNPFALESDFEIDKISSFIEEEMEVVSFSPVAVSKAVFFYNINEELNQRVKEWVKDSYKILGEKIITPRKMTTGSAAHIFSIITKNLKKFGINPNITKEWADHFRSYLLERGLSLNSLQTIGNRITSSESDFFFNPKTRNKVMKEMIKLLG